MELRQIGHLIRCTGTMRVRMQRRAESTPAGFIPKSCAVIESVTESGSDVPVPGVGVGVEICRYFWASGVESRRTSTNAEL